MKTVEFDNLLVQTIGVTSACMQAQPLLAAHNKT